MTRFGLRARITALATVLVAIASGLLLWLGWLLAGGVTGAVPQLPPGSTVLVGGIEVDATQLASVLRDEARARVLVSGSIAFVCVVLATGLLAWTITGRVLHPLRQITGTARRLSAESLGQRITYRGPRDELAELADTFDEMLDRLQAAFDAQRRFVANASHELRTPLAVIRTELDVTLADQDADVAELRRMAGVVRDATLRAERLVDALLVLARTDGIGIGPPEPVDLAAVATTAWQAVKGAADARELRVSTHLTPVRVAGDPALLERVAGNLLENAVRHNVSGGWIEVRAEPAGPVALLRVASSGPVIDPARVGELFEPFRRGGVDRTAQSGAGLGLSIVRSVVLAHHGDVAAEPMPGGGLAVTVRLPVAT